METDNDARLRGRLLLSAFYDLDDSGESSDGTSDVADTLDEEEAQGNGIDSQNFVVDDALEQYLACSKVEDLVSANNALCAGTLLQFLVLSE